MAHLPHLFFSTDTDKQTLHLRVVPNEQQRQLQQERWNDLRDFLVEDLHEKTGCTLSSWLQGSYKFKTQVRPARIGDEIDIDLGVYFSWDGNPDEGNYTPRQLKALVQESLKTYAEEAREDVIEVVTPPKERCSRIRFSESFHIDVPTYHLDPKRDKRSLATETKGWEESDPKALYLWFKASFGDEDSSLVRRLIRYMKIWANLKYTTNGPSSILLTVLVAEAFGSLDATDVDGEDVAVRNIANSVRDRLLGSSEVRNPVNIHENLNRLSSSETHSFVENLNSLIDIADRALAAPGEFATAVIWSEAFDHFFPIPVQQGVVATKGALVPVRFTPEVQIKAVSNDNPNYVRRGVNEIGPIVKNCKLNFWLSNANDLPPGARVDWMVRNEGEEAEFVNDLGHDSGRQAIHTEERSAYNGTHFMDVTVRSALGDVLGFRRIPVKVAGSKKPLRIPKKPGVLKLRQGRK